MSEEYIPSFYKEFRCVAGKCPDTCCKDWDIVVDESAYKFYESLNGEYGENIRQSMITHFRPVTFYTKPVDLSNTSEKNVGFYYKICRFNRVII